MSRLIFNDSLSAHVVQVPSYPTIIDSNSNSNSILNNNNVNNNNNECNLIMLAVDPRIHDFTASPSHKFWQILEVSRDSSLVN